MDFSAFFKNTAFFGVQITAVLNVIIIVLWIIYLQIFFQSSFGKKMLSLVLVMLVQMTMDVLGLKITSMFLGYYEFLDKDSVFTAIGAGISAVLITAGIYGLYRFWIIVEKVQWNFRRNQWFCLILPLSQSIIIQQAAVRYTLEFHAVPAAIVWGIILGFLADMYMFVLFYQSNRRDQAQLELSLLTHQYEMEQLRYEQLKETQEEAAKIRHDFQNYVIAMRAMVRQ